MKIQLIATFVALLNCLHVASAQDFDQKFSPGSDGARFITNIFTAYHGATDDAATRSLLNSGSWHGLLEPYLQPSPLTLSGTTNIREAMIGINGIYGSWGMFDTQRPMATVEFTRDEMTAGWFRLPTINLRDASDINKPPFSQWNYGGSVKFEGVESKVESTANGNILQYNAGGEKAMFLLPKVSEYTLSTADQQLSTHMQKLQELLDVKSASSPLSFASYLFGRYVKPATNHAKADRALENATFIAATYKDWLALEIKEKMTFGPDGTLAQSSLFSSSTIDASGNLLLETQNGVVITAPRDREWKCFVFDVGGDIYIAYRINTDIANGISMR